MDRRREREEDVLCDFCDFCDLRLEDSPPDRTVPSSSLPSLSSVALELPVPAASSSLAFPAATLCADAERFVSDRTDTVSTASSKDSSFSGPCFLSVKYIPSATFAAMSPTYGLLVRSVDHGMLVVNRIRLVQRCFLGLRHVGKLCYGKKM